MPLSLTNLQTRPPIWVIKIGGSLLGAPELMKWLELVVKHSDGQVIIVPGGAIFADAVREAQRLTQVDDKLAHHLALLAMDQYGLLMAGMHKHLVTASSELEIAERGWQHRGIVWLPSKMALADETIPQNWQVTSDSISAWLANKLKAEHLVIVKSKPLEIYKKNAEILIENLIEGELLDGQIVDFVTGQTYQTWIVNKQDYGLFNKGFSAAQLQKNALLLNIKTH